ncbi:hypothetical protein B0H10DRAFT_2031167 [Mycena sp. CBHHK59/15]|nr:hypothetical protein B0H10DRAFT_2031167 [Mycena sp. CBHHK59/15]
MATNHIGPFLLTKLLTQKILAAGTATYCGHALWGTAQYQSMETYFQTKSANILTAIELSKRSKGKINAYSVHPGMIYTNIIQNGDSLAAMQAIGVLDADGKPTTEGTVAAAFDTQLNDKPGAYLSDSTEANKHVAPHSSDPGNAEKLWTTTEEIIGETFTF